MLETSMKEAARNTPLGIPRHKWGDNVKADLNNYIGMHFTGSKRASLEDYREHHNKIQIH
jgi:hypothetical protein